MHVCICTNITIYNFLQRYVLRGAESSTYMVFMHPFTLLMCEDLSWVLDLIPSFNMPLGFIH